MTTKKESKKDVSEEVSELLAKSKKHGAQLLVDHLNGVSKEAKRQIESIFGDEDKTTEKALFAKDLAFAGEWAGKLHDIGKAMPSFQAYIKTDYNADDEGVAPEEEEKDDSDTENQGEAGKTDQEKVVSGETNKKTDLRVTGLPHEIAGAFSLKLSSVSKALDAVLDKHIKTNACASNDSKPVDKLFEPALRKERIKNAIQMAVLWHHGKRIDNEYWKAMFPYGSGEDHDEFKIKTIRGKLNKKSKQEILVVSKFALAQIRKIENEDNEPKIEDIINLDGENNFLPPFRTYRTIPVRNQDISSSCGLARKYLFLTDLIKVREGAPSSHLPLWEEKMLFLRGKEPSIQGWKDNADTKTNALLNLHTPPYRYIPGAYSNSTEGVADRSLYEIDRMLNIFSDIVLKAVISADWVISGLNCEGLKKYLDNPQAIEKGIQDESKGIKLLGTEDKSTLEAAGLEVERYKDTVEWAGLYAKRGENIIINRGVSGIGKTLWTLSFIEQTKAQRVLWVCPRVPIVKGVFRELKKEAAKHKMSLSIGALSGEFKEAAKFEKGTEKIDTQINLLQCEILVTTIDFLLGGYINHGRSRTLLDSYGGTVVIDEYHEMGQIPMIFALLSEFVEARKYTKNSKTVLLSATPCPPMLYFWGLRPSNPRETNQNFWDDGASPDGFQLMGLNDVFNIKRQSKNKILTKKHKLFVKSENAGERILPVVLREELKNKGETRKAIIALNTVGLSQRAFIDTRDSNSSNLLFHGDFSRRRGELSGTEDSSEWSKGLDQILDQHNKEKINDGGDIISAQILKASLNISAPDVVHFSAGPDNDVQLWGRNDRWGSFQEEENWPRIIVAVDNKCNSNNKVISMQLNAGFVERWVKSLKEPEKNASSNNENTPVSNEAIYRKYDTFWGNELGIYSREINGQPDAEKETQSYNQQEMEISGYHIYEWNLFEGCHLLTAGRLSPLRAPSVVTINTQNATAQQAMRRQAGLRGDTAGSYAQTLVFKNENRANFGDLTEWRLERQTEVGQEPSETDSPCILVDAKEMDIYYLKKLTGRKVDASDPETPYIMLPNITDPKVTKIFENSIETAVEEAIAAHRKRNKKDLKLSDSDIAKREIKALYSAIRIYARGGNGAVGLGLIKIKNLISDSDFIKIISGGFDSNEGSDKVENLSSLLSLLSSVAGKILKEYPSANNQKQQKKGE